MLPADSGYGPTVIDAHQYQKIVEVAFSGGSSAFRDTYTATTLPAADAKLIVAIAQLAIPATEIEMQDRILSYIGELAVHVYRHAGIEGAPVPGLNSVPTTTLRVEFLKTHAAQLAGKPSAALAFALTHTLMVEEGDTSGDLLQTLGDALGIDDDLTGYLMGAFLDVMSPDDD